ncbi:MAG: OmpA family protein [Myxococcales bacterium]|nr:OmpA family protein [Myxococcales bacterium]
MRQRRTVQRLLATVAVCGGLGLFHSTPVAAQTAPATTLQGFTLNRYEPTAAGEWSFWVDHPWYSSTRYFAGGITLNYGHNPLQYGPVIGDKVEPSQAVIAHQLLGHADLAFSFLDRVLITASLPITLLERGTETAGVKPTSGVVVGDPRVGLMLRIAGQPYRSGASLSIGALGWIPLRQFTSVGVSPTSSDSAFRIMPKLVLGGIASSIFWSLTGGFLYRSPAQLGDADPVGSTVGSEVQIGVALGYASVNKRFAIVPEAVLSTAVLGNDTVQVKPFSRDYTSLELLLGLHYNIASVFQIGLAGGLGTLRTPGTPDGRALLRLAYAPIREVKPEPPSDRDNDGIPDKGDACPDTPGIRTTDPATTGCPDRDRDRVVDKLDLCPDEPQGVRPDPSKLGCPLRDRDGDGIFDIDDRCPETPQGLRPDPEKPGCPQIDKDRDGDGFLDSEDQCPDVHKGNFPDADKPGCPTPDRDNDGVVDPQDQCPDEPKGARPDPSRLGCPWVDKDRDSDKIPDSQDACPDKAGVPNVDPAKHGCPSLVEFKEGKIAIVKPVFFATNKDIILQESYPVLQSVADVLKASPEIKKVSIEGHTDNRGKPEWNRDLSERRARSVKRWLIEHGVEESRLQSLGYGPWNPIATNDTPQGRERNRRVEFVIIDPPQSSSVKSIDASQVEVPVSPDQSDNSPAAPRPAKRPVGGKQGGAKTPKKGN